MTVLLESGPAPALLWQDGSLSYSELLSRARAWAGRLHGGNGLVALFAENRPEWACAFYGAWAAGQAVVPLDHLSTAEEVAYVLEDCRPGAVFCSQDTRLVLDRALALCAHRPCVLDLGDDASAPAAGAEAAAAPIGAREEALALVVYTSGTTGNPKGVRLSFANLLANIRPVAEEGYYDRDARVLLLLPLHHVLPLVGALVAPLFTGGRVVLATSLAGEALVETMRRHGVTTLVGVPRLYDLLAGAFRSRIEASGAARMLYRVAARAGSRRFSRLAFASAHRRLGGRLRHLICGGAALDRETARLFDTLGFMVCEGYGMTECAPMIAFPRLRGAELKLGSCGQPLQGCEVRLENGEILVRGPNVMLGYHGRPEETAEVLRDGWLRTGDLGRLDDDGFLYVTGRAKEILVLPSGKNVNPALAEAELQEASPLVREAGVFLDVESLHAVVVAEGLDEARLRDEVLARYNARVAPYKRITRATLVAGELPRTRLGKLRRHRLPAIAAAAARPEEPKAGSTGDPALGAITGFLSRQCGRPVHAGSRLDADLGLDSLGRVELAAFLERAFGVEVPESRLAAVETVAALALLAGGPATAEAGPGGGWSGILDPATPPRLPRSTPWHRAMVYASRALVRTAFATRASGAGRLPEGPCILAANHQSFLDGLFATAHLPPRTVLRTLFYAKAKHVDRGWLRFLADRCNVVVASADEGFRVSLQKLAAALRRGDVVLIFPEGTRSAEGALGPFRESYAILARELGVPVVPVAIDGAHRALPVGRRVPRLLARVSVSYLEPLRPAAGESAGELNGRVRDAIAARLAGAR